MIYPVIVLIMAGGVIAAADHLSCSPMFASLLKDIDREVQPPFPAAPSWPSAVS